MKVLNQPVHDVLASAYRTTFREYSNKLEALQRLMDCSIQDSARIESTLLEVEKARVAHSCARDRLARVLVDWSSATASPPVSTVSQVRIRETAQLLWELAGRPEGTAEYDWRRAEKLVQTAAAWAC